MERLKIIDEVVPELLGQKFVPYLLTSATVSRNNDYFLVRDVDVEKHIVTGIEWDYYDGTISRYPATMVWKGSTYNVLQSIDFKTIFVNYRGKKNKYLLRNCPAATFIPYPLQVNAFKLELDLATSYIKFNFTPLATPLPIIIPITYFFDREYIFK